MRNCFTICVDMDDTIENLLVAWVTYLNERYDLEVDIEDIHEWNMQKAFPSLTLGQIQEPLHMRSLWKTVTPKADAVIYLKKLMDEHQQVYICTCSHYGTLQNKVEEVLLKYFPYIDWRQIIVAHDKQMINCDILIDDGPHNLKDGKYFKILFDAPHNRAYDAEKNQMIRAKNWEEVYRIIHELDCIYSMNNLKTVDNEGKN